MVKTPAAFSLGTIPFGSPPRLAVSIFYKATQILSSAKRGMRFFDGEINDLKSLDEALELGVVKERGKGLVAL
jgi:hypothetical protein